MEGFGLMDDPVASAVCAWVVSTAVELSDLHALRAIGYLALSVEALIVTWFWPRLFPARRVERSSQHHHRRSHRHRRRRDDATAQHAITPDSARSRRDGSVERWGEQDDVSELRSDGGRNDELPSSVLSDGIPALASSRGGRGANKRRITGYSEANPSTWESLLATRPTAIVGQDSIPAKLPGANKDGSVTRRTKMGWVRQTRVSWVRRIFLVLFTLSATYLATCLVFSGTWNSILVPEKPPNQGTGIVGGPGSCGTTERCVVAGTRQSEEIEGAKRGEGEGGFRTERPNVYDEIRREEGTRPRRKVEEAKKEDYNEKERPKRRWEFWGREERGDVSKNGRQDSASAEAGVKAGADVNVAETERERARLMKKESEAAAATKKEKTKTAGTTATPTAGKDVYRRREIAEAERLRKEEFVLSVENVVARRQGLWDWRKQGKNNGIAPETCSYALEEGDSLGLEQALRNGPTEMKLMANGDLVLSFDGVGVWLAQGSKKRRNVLGWIWRKIRRRASLWPCLNCRFTVTSSGRLEIRERRKLLWSDGLPKRDAKRNKPIPAATSPGSVSAHAESCVVEIRSTYRLEVTDGGNAVLKLGDSEVVWKALST